MIHFVVCDQPLKLDLTKVRFCHFLQHAAEIIIFCMSHAEVYTHFALIRITIGFKESVSIVLQSSTL